MTSASARRVHWWHRLEGLLTRYGERGQQPGESPGFISAGSLRARRPAPVGSRGWLTVRMRVWLVSVLAVVVALAAVAGAALLFWPQVHLGQSDAALARLSLPGFAGRVTTVDVSSASEGTVPVALRDGELWPLRQVAAGERLTVVVTVRRPGWAGWLVGHDQRRSFSVAHAQRTPPRPLAAGAASGSPVTVAFDYAGHTRVVPGNLDPPRRRAPWCRSCRWAGPAAGTVRGRSRSRPPLVPGSTCRRRAR